MISDYLNGISTRTYNAEEKEALLAYMSKRLFLDWASSKRIKDRVNGETVNTLCFVGYSDGMFEWDSAEIYHLEKYDLKLSEAFIRHVLEKSEQ